MASMPSSAVYRLQKDFKQLMDDPVPGLVAQPNPQNILEWFFVISGPSDTPFEGGFYLGSLKFPPEYPFKAPGLIFHTPNGRFATQTRICLSITDYHQEQWNPTWNVGSILNATISFMTGNEPTFGAIRGSIPEKKALANQSLAWCLNNENFRTHFPSLVANIEKELKDENKYDTAMEEYVKLKEEAKKNPRPPLTHGGFDDFHIQFVRDMMMGDHVRQPPGFVRPAGPLNQVEKMAVEEGNDVGIGLARAPPANRGDPANIADAMQRRMYMLHARRAQVQRHEGEGPAVKMRELREGVRLRARGELAVPVRINPPAVVAVPEPPARPAAIVYDEMKHLEERERMKAILATHLGEIEKMNQETLEKLRGKKVEVPAGSDTDSGSSGGESSGSSSGIDTLKVGRPVAKPAPDAPVEQDDFGEFSDEEDDAFDW